MNKKVIIILHCKTCKDITRYGRYLDVDEHGYVNLNANVFKRECFYHPMTCNKSDIESVSIRITDDDR